MSATLSARLAEKFKSQKSKMENVRKRQEEEKIAAALAEAEKKAQKKRDKKVLDKRLEPVIDLVVMACTECIDSQIKKGESFAHVLVRKKSGDISLFRNRHWVAVTKHLLSVYTLSGPASGRLGPTKGSSFIVEQCSIVPIDEITNHRFLNLIGDRYEEYSDNSEETSEEEDYILYCISAKF